MKCFYLCLMYALIASLFTIGCDDDNDDSAGYVDGDADGDADSDAGCPEVACGPCGQVSLGDTAISDDPRLDGMFAAVVYLQEAVNDAKSGISSGIETVAAAAQIDMTGKSTADIAADIVSAVEAVISANLESGVTAAYQAPVCASNGSQGLLALERCEAKMECDVEECQLRESAFACAGFCMGTCEGSSTPAEGVTCNADFCGTCDGECSGNCLGEIFFGSCNNCEATPDCSPQASSQAFARLYCSPPTLTLTYDFKATVDAGKQTEVNTLIEKYRKEVLSLVQYTTMLQLLTEGNDDLDMEAPVAYILAIVSAQMQGVANGEIETENPVKLPCAVNAFEEAMTITASIPTEVAGDIAAGLEVISILDI